MTVMKKEKALEYFKSNFNCSQAVFSTFAVEMGLTEELALKIATSFGGGARCGQLCGAVSGALMVLGLRYGHSHAGDMEEKAGAYALAVEFNRRFCQKNDSVVCKELLGYDLTIPEEAAQIKADHLFLKVCPELITDAIEIVEQLLSEKNEAGNDRFDQK